MKFSINLDANSLRAALYSAWSFQPLDGSNISGLTPGIALGIPNQEKIIYKHLNKFKKGIFVGVGGSLDVISGSTFFYFLYLCA